MAAAIECADDERGNGWWLRENDRHLWLMTCHLFACAVAPSKVRVSVIGPISEDVRAVLGAEAEDDAEFKFIPGGLILTFPAERAAEALPLLKHLLTSFLEAARRVYVVR
jgi:hypothetical protein